MKKTAVYAALALAATLIGGVSNSPAATAAPTPAPAPQAADASAAARADALDGFKRHLAEEVARRLGDRRLRDALTHELAGDGEADLAALLGSVPGTQDLAAYARDANSQILKLKGIEAEGALLQIRIDPQSVERISAGGTLVMATPSGDEKTVRTVVAYGSNGHTQELDAFRAPQRPVLIVGLDEHKSAELAQQTIRRYLTEAGIGGTDRSAADEPQTSNSLATRPVSTVFRIVNRDDHEPWYKGGPEIYAWVAGAGLDGKARVDQVEMPYITKEGTVYSPGQSLIEWSNFSWTSVDVVFMEHDDNSDLSGLIRAVVDGVLTVAGYEKYVPVADKIVAALPSGWTKDDDDWVDSCYNINRQTTDVHCAAIPSGMSLVLAFHWL